MHGELTVEVALFGRAVHPGDDCEGHHHTYDEEADAVDQDLQIGLIGQGRGGHGFVDKKETKLAAWH